MQEIVASHAPRLRALGFRRRRHGFNRTVGDGIVHVVLFWLAPHEPSAWTEVPGLRERRYGSFRIDVGVHVPEMVRSHVPRGPWIGPHDCALRRTIGQLVDGDDSADLWWRLDEPGVDAVAGTALEAHGLPWLDRFGDHAAVLAAFDAGGPLPMGLSPAGALDVADLLRATGDTARERGVLEAYVAQPVLHTHAPYLAAYLSTHGHLDLVDRIRTARPGG